MHQELFIEGVWYPSVTTVMNVKPKPWLDVWKAKWGVMAVRKTKIADAIGTEFHRCVESWINTGAYIVTAPSIDGFAMPSTMTRIAGMMLSFLKWAQAVEGEVHHTEMQVISHKHVYSGTLDAIGTLKGKPMLFDWKTSSRIYNEMQLQLTAYAHAYNEQYALPGDRVWRPVKDGLIVHVSKDKPHFRLSTREFKLGKRPFKEFLKLREMFDTMQTQEAMK